MYIDIMRLRPSDLGRALSIALALVSVEESDIAGAKCFTKILPKVSSI